MEFATLVRFGSGYMKRIRIIPNWLIIDGESWIANPFVPNTNNKTRRFMGMGGRMLEAISNDGRKIISNDWWHQGKIPEEFKDLIPDNAKWVK